MLIYVEIFRLASYNRALIGKQTSLYFGVIFIVEYEAFMLECGLMTVLHKTIIVSLFFIVINTCFLDRRKFYKHFGCTYVALSGA